MFSDTELHFEVRYPGGWILKQRSRTTWDYCYWNSIARYLYYRIPECCWEVQSVREVGSPVVATGHLTILYMAIASEPR
jgi:hypothetical protein